MSNSFPDWFTIWTHYPLDRSPSKDGHPNQCAIRLSKALQEAGLDMSDYGQPVTSEGWARGAQEFTYYLNRVYKSSRRFSGKEPSVKRAIAAKRGIIFFRNITGFLGGRGDHIDLWDGISTEGSEPFGRCQKIWFWRM